MTVPYTFDEIKNKVLQKFSDKGYVVEEGSNTAMFADILAYLAFYANLNSTFAAQESNINTAVQYKNVVSNAKSIGYIPKGYSSYAYKIKLSDCKTLLFGQEFSANGNTFHYLGDSLKFTTPTEVEIEVYEGELIQDTFTLDEDVKYIDLPYDKLAENAVSFKINNVLWKKSNSVLLDKQDGENNKFIMFNYPDTELDYTRFYFYLASMGETVAAGSTIEWFALQSKGSEGEGSTDKDEWTFVVENDAGTIESVELINIGASPEAAQDIKTNAPLINNTGNRLVTELDYNSFLKTFSELLIYSAWGGENEPTGYSVTGAEQPDYGSAYLTFVAKTAPLFDFNNFKLDSATDFTNYIFPFEGSRIQKAIDELKVITIQQKHRNVVFIDVEVNIKVINYGVGISEADANTNIFNAIQTYFQENITKLNSTFYLSNLISLINKIANENETGVTVSITTKIPLFASNADSDGNIVIWLSPNIREKTQVTFGETFGEHTLSLSEGTVTEFNTQKDVLIDGTTKIGQIVTSKKTKDDRLQLNLNGLGITLSDTEPVYLEIKYDDDSFITQRNTITRLIGVNFA